MKRTKKQFRNAFTLVEVMAVLIILGLLATVAVTNFMGKTDQAKVTTTKANLKVLNGQVLSFKMDTGRYPEEEEGLYALIEEPTDVEGWQPGGYLNSTELPVDGWGNDFIFQRDPESGKAFVIISYGADGEPEGEDYNADLYSTDAY
ncbi:MAG: type II secretion system major pseudopilin GspG [Planctomycetes bacterium]|nr:type II secretion system major pseudopilin GspG [Planctomycetota bacterium]